MSNHWVMRSRIAGWNSSWRPLIFRALHTFTHRRGMRQEMIHLIYGNERRFTFVKAVDEVDEILVLVHAP